VDSGLSIEEALTLRPTDIDMNNFLFKVFGKGRKERLVPFSVERRKFLHQWHQKKEKGGWTGEWVFTTRDGSRLTQRNALRAHYILLAKVGLPKSGFHRLRHTFATNYLRRRQHRQAPTYPGARQHHHDAEV
jgi:integrase/recombinase XerD